AQVLKDWGAANRFAGSGDRAAISAIVYDALRVRASAGWIMQADTPRAIALGAMVRIRGMDADKLAALCSGSGHAPAELTQEERERIAAHSMQGAPDHVAADIPEWLEAPMQRAFGERVVAECEAMTHRAPVDLRVNLLKTNREKALAALSHLGAEETPLSPWGLRLPLGRDGRGPALAAEPAYARGTVELQDEGSQIAALLSGAEAGSQVLDLCAGAGGKTLALAAMMGNRGQIFATDSDGRRLMPIYKRLENAGVRNVQVRAPKAGRDILADLEDRCQLVFADAPCTGSGTWRRNPDAKWRIRPGALDQRMREQDEVLETAAIYVRPAGRLVYVTCSVFCEENEDRIAAFLERNSNFAPVEPVALAAAAGVEKLAGFASPHGPGLRLSPAVSGTDGFYIAVLARLV
ncbi:MAG: RsmB/NOP family class I SAM-dependent RNA methyltransferase, partial [Beijerinckiaceae bacterium]